MHLHLPTVADDFAEWDGQGRDLDGEDLAALAKRIEGREDLWVGILHHLDVLEAPRDLLREVLVVIVKGEVPGEDNLPFLILSHSPTVFEESLTLTSILSELDDDVSFLGVDTLALLLANRVLILSDGELSINALGGEGQALVEEFNDELLELALTDGVHEG